VEEDIPSFTLMFGLCSSAHQPAHSTLLLPASCPVLVPQYHVCSPTMLLLVYAPCNLPCLYLPMYAFPLPSCMVLLGNLPCLVSPMASGSHTFCTFRRTHSPSPSSSSALCLVRSACSLTAGGVLSFRHTPARAFLPTHAGYPSAWVLPFCLAGTCAPQPHAVGTT